MHPACRPRLEAVRLSASPAAQRRSPGRGERPWHYHRRAWSARPVRWRNTRPGPQEADKPAVGVQHVLDAGPDFDVVCAGSNELPAKQAKPRRTVRSACHSWSKTRPPEACRSAGVGAPSRAVCRYRACPKDGCAIHSGARRTEPVHRRATCRPDGTAVTRCACLVNWCRRRMSLVISGPIWASDDRW